MLKLEAFILALRRPQFPTPTDKLWALAAKL
jgi:hypothetical protein